MTLKASKNANNLVLAVSAARNANNQLYKKDPEQGKPGDGGKKDETVKKDIYEQSTFQGSSPVGPNLYVDACWKPKTAGLNTPVTIYALLNAQINSKVIVNIFHRIDGENKLVETISENMTLGKVEFTWKTKNPAKNWNKGHYFFMIIGGNANSVSNNNLTLS